MSKPAKPTKKPNERAVGAGGWYIWHTDGRCDYGPGKDVEEAVSLYSGKVRRQIIAVIQADAVPNGGLPVATDLAFIVTRTRIERSINKIVSLG